MRRPLLFSSSMRYLLTSITRTRSPFETFRAGSLRVIRAQSPAASSLLAAGKMAPSSLAGQARVMMQVIYNIRTSSPWAHARLTV